VLIKELPSSQQANSHRGVSVNCHLHDNRNRTGDENALLDTVPKRATLTRAHPNNGIVRTIENYNHNRLGFFMTLDPSNKVQENQNRERGGGSIIHD
jgi:hypothetical protein